MVKLISKLADCGSMRPVGACVEVRRISWRPACQHTREGCGPHSSCISPLHDNSGVIGLTHTIRRHLLSPAPTKFDHTHSTQV